MLKYFLWLKYLHKRKIVLLSMATVAVSVALLIVVASLFTGFIAAFESSAADFIGDVVISGPRPIAKFDELIQRLKDSGIVEEGTGIISGQGLLNLGKGRVRAVSVWGVEPEKRVHVTKYKEALMRQKDANGPVSFVYEGKEDKVGGFVGIAVLCEPDEETDEYDTEAVREMIGKQVVLTTGTVLRESDETGKVEFKRKVVPFVVSDVMFTGVYDLDRRFVYLPRERVQEVIYPDEREPVADQVQIRLVSELNKEITEAAIQKIKITRKNAALAATLDAGKEEREKAIKGAEEAEITDDEIVVTAIRIVWEEFAEKELQWGPYTISSTDVETSRQMQGQYVYELHKQMQILLFIFGIVDCTVILLISCIFYMIVRMKRKDIGVIKSCGTSGGSVVGLFLGFGISVGVIGAGVGTVLGYVITRNVNVLEEWIRVVFGLKLWKSDVYMFSRIPNVVDWPSVGTVVIFAIIAAGVGALIPAILAARTRPVEILQYE